MPLPPCTLVAESVHLSVGYGVAVVAHEAHVRARPGGCTLDGGATLRAREEGRAAPEVVAFRYDVAGRTVVVGGPRARAAIDLSDEAIVRLVAVLRGDRFAAVPFAIDPGAVLAPVPVRVVTDSVWGTGRVAGVARWVDTGTPAVIAADPTRDRESPRASLRVARGAIAGAGAVADAGAVPDSGLVPVLVLDAGPRQPSEAAFADEGARLEALARGGVEAVSVLLSDLPLAIATSPDAPAALERLRESARAARAAAASSDPLLAAVGQRLASAIATGFSSCARAGAPAWAERWPQTSAALAGTGLLDDVEGGCPRVADLLSVAHPDVRFAQEGGALLAEAAHFRALPRVGPLERLQNHGGGRARRARPILVTALVTALAAVVALVLAAAGLSRPGWSR